MQLCSLAPRRRTRRSTCSSRHGLQKELWENRAIGPSSQAQHGSGGTRPGQSPVPGSLRLSSPSEAAKSCSGPMRKFDGNRQTASSSIAPGASATPCNLLSCLVGTRAAACIDSLVLRIAEYLAWLLHVLCETLLFLPFFFSVAAFTAVEATVRHQRLRSQISVRAALAASCIAS